MPNWKSPDATSRLLAAVIASVGKIDCRKIATYYGEGATYDAIEGRLRILKKLAQTLRSEVESGQRPEAPPRGALKSSSSSSPACTKKPAGKKNAVLGGRIRKANAPAKGKGKGVKIENDTRGGKIKSEYGDGHGERVDDVVGQDNVEDADAGGDWMESNAAGFQALALGLGAEKFDDEFDQDGEVGFEEGMEV